MRNKCLFLLMLCLPLLAGAQKKFDYTISKPFKVIDARNKYYFSDIAKEKALSIKIDGKDIYMQSFDAKTMKELKRKEYDDFPKGFVIEQISWFEEHLYCFFSLWDRDAGKEQLFYREIDFDNCSFKGKEKRMLTVDGKLSGAPAAYLGMWSLGTVDKFAFLFSRDSSRMLVQYRRDPEIKRDKLSHDIIGMFIFDKELNPIAGNDIKMPYTEKKMDNVDYCVDAAGTPYMLAKVYDDNTTKDTKGKGDEKTANYHMELFKVDVKAKTVSTAKIEVDNQFIKDIWIYEGAGNAMLCAGFYNKKVSGWRWSSSISEGDADGLFLFKLDKDGAILDKKFYEIPTEIINQYTKAGGKKEKEKKNNKAELAHLNLREMLIGSDNSIVLIGEQYFVETTTDYRGNTTYSYHYNDILIAKIDPDGSLGWMRKLPKRQTGGAARGGMGFKRLTIGGNHYLVFLDNVKNLKLDLNERPATHADGMGGYLTAYSINDQTGIVNKVSIFDTREVAGGMEVFQFRTNRVLQISETEFLSEFYKKDKEDVMIKIKVK